MKTLIVKLGATGDVVRTTPLLRQLTGEVVWLTASRNKPLLEGLEGLPVSLEVINWEDRSDVKGRSFDLLIQLEDDAETAAIQKSVSATRLFGAYAGDDGVMSYTSDSSRWFELSLISEFGRTKADELKLRNRSTYQELIFEGLGLHFAGEEYFLPPTVDSKLIGDVAIAPEAGTVWPMKKWAHFEWLKSELELRGLKVNYLPTRPTLLEHLADVRGHRCVVSGDSLPMHLALGSRTTFCPPFCSLPKREGMEPVGIVFCLHRTLHRKYVVLRPRCSHRISLCRSVSNTQDSRRK
jgi:hypothetical protein